ncbi:MAG: hypothetical protein ACI8ZB_003687 [Desulforhopalus sp.]|jgi:hypothetical protein
MVFFPFRQTRIESNLPVWLRLQETSTKQLHPGQVSGTIINISKGGACLRIPKLLINGKHLFFTTLNSTHTLLLQLQMSTDTFDDVSIPANSVWMDSVEHLNHMVFKVGISFTAEQTELFGYIKNTSVLNTP